MISDMEAVGEPLGEFGDEHKRRAMNLFMDAWDQGCTQGIPSELLSEVCLYLALTDLVEEHGEDDVADILETIPLRIRLGEFTVGEERH